MSIEFIFRLIGMVVFAILGAYLGVYIGNTTDNPQKSRVLILPGGNTVWIDPDTLFHHPTHPDNPQDAY